MIILKILALVALFLIMSFFTKIMISSFKKLTRNSKNGEFALSSLFIAFGTSIPELVIAVDFALKARPEISLGNILGSNIANLSLVIGGATLLSGKLKVVSSIVKNDVYYAFLISASPLLLLSDGRLDKVDGIILLLLYLVWQSIVFTKKKTRRINLFSRLKNKSKGILPKWKLILTLITGIGGLLVSAELIVNIAINIASSLHISSFILGVFILGVGSALPELAFEIRAIRNKEGEIVFGNLLGSIVTNSSLIMGITVIISPITLTNPWDYFTTILFFLIAFFLFYTFIKTKLILEKWEAAFLVASYIVFIALKF
jgi:cation:H+ antiporter